MAEEISQEKEKPRMHGCLKGCLIFLGVCVLAFVVMVGVVYYKGEAIKTWAVERTFDTIETRFMDNLPEGVDKEEVKETLERLKIVVIEGELSRNEVKKMLSEFERAMEDEKLDADEINHLLEVINEAIEQGFPETSSI